MDFFDLHCDTALRLLETGESLADATGHVSLKKAKGLRRWAQVFALFVHDNKTGCAFAQYCRERDSFREQIKKNGSTVRLCKNGQEIEAAFSAGQYAAILSVENGSVLEGKIERLKTLSEDGIQLLTLTWFGENEIGYGSVAGGPLKPFGKQVVSRLNDYNILPDVSHLSDEGVTDVFSLYDGPILATHSNARKVTGHCRNLTDAQIREIVRRKGLIGLNLYVDFLCGRASDSMDAVYRHLIHFLDLGAEHVLCFGTDFDGSTPLKDVEDLTKIPVLYDYLLQRGVKETLLQNVFFENAHRFWMNRR
ncbi:dipeptidase [uncultured Ruthenibacterium sp.]|uniref:dipeptidase n=1 Tax=uncultured Ruthenibacterium sp. TaxID=1905347 RepID=UPI00349E968F